MATINIGTNKGNIYSKRSKIQGPSKMTFVESTKTENTGGNVMVDFLTLNDGTLLAISADTIGLYKNIDDFDNGEEAISFIVRS